MASVDTAWTFWVNSPIHYAGLTNARYSDVGLGVAYGDTKAYVMVFGNPGGDDAVAVSVNRNSEAGGNGASAVAGPPPPPSFVVGVDAVGNIMHEVQPDDTMGDIAMTYGYDWADIPQILELNEMTWDDIRVMKIGSVVLVPPYEGTYTPTPPGFEAAATSSDSAASTSDGSDSATATVTSTVEILGLYTATPTQSVTSVAQASPEAVLARDASMTPEQSQTAGPTATPATTDTIPASSGTTRVAALPPVTAVSSESTATSQPSATPQPSATIRLVVDTIGQPTASAQIVALPPDAAPADDAQTSPVLLAAIIGQALVLGAAFWQYWRNR